MSTAESQILEKPSKVRAIELPAPAEVEGWSAAEILIWGLKNYHPGIVLSASFGAPEGIVLLDMMHRIEPESRVFVLDTGRLHQATHDLIDWVRQRYEKQVEVIFPDPSDVTELVSSCGMNCFYESIENRKRCCRIRKVEPMRRYLAGFDAYVTGLRRDQNANRADTPKIQVDYANRKIIKINPIADWTHDQVWDYVRTHSVPVNRLHAEGYPSVGCAPCSRAIGPDEDARAGRWWWEHDDTRECGLHVQAEEQGSGI